MPNNLQLEQPKQKMDQGERETLDKLVREQVLHALGTPLDLRDVQVKKLWADHFRVNVIVGVNAASVRVANSHFVVIDSNGSLISATPTITKQY